MRDDRPDIAAPGQWSLFGGVIAEGETPREAIRRELWEELCLRPARFQSLGFRDYFAEFEKEVIRNWLFLSDVTRIWKTHSLREGRGAAVFSFHGLEKLAILPVMKTFISEYHEDMRRSARRSNEGARRRAL